jgi:hypothetical protein
MAVIRGGGSQAGVRGGELQACNGVVYVMDRVLLPVDADGELTDAQAEFAEKIKEAMRQEEEDLEERGGGRRRH